MEEEKIEQTQIVNNASKVINYLNQLKDSLEAVPPPSFIKMAQIESHSIYQPINELMPIFAKYKDGQFDIHSSQEDLLKMSSISARLAQFAGFLKANTKHQNNVKKLENSKAQIAIKDLHAQNIANGLTSQKLTDNDVKNIAEVHLKELYEITYEYECFSEIFDNMLQLVIHFSTILNSITKRAADELRM